MQIISNIALISINETLFFQLISFLIFLFIINRLMFRPLQSVMVERDNHIGQIQRDILDKENEFRNLTIQLKQHESAIKEEAFKLIFAYEPVWAIGTGEICGVSDAVEVVKIIRETIDGKFGSVSGNIPILYGGSVSEGTIEEFAKKDEIDGVLVGGASLKADEFLKIIEAYK